MLGTIADRRHFRSGEEKADKPIARIDDRRTTIPRLCKGTGHDLIFEPDNSGFAHVDIECRADGTDDAFIQTRSAAALPYVHPGLGLDRPLKRANPQDIGVDHRRRDRPSDGTIDEIPARWPSRESP